MLCQFGTRFNAKFFQRSSLTIRATSRLKYVLSRLVDW